MQEKKFKISTLGCRTNQYESEAYATQLRTLGYREAGEGEEADICIVNTCTVTESADSSSRHQIRQLHRQNPGASLVVTGCLAERLPNELKAIPGVTHLVPNKDKENLLASVFPDEELPEFKIDQFSAHTRAFVKVQDGCNSYCTYCIIPYVRGRSRSKPMDEILEESTSETMLGPMARNSPISLERSIKSRASREFGSLRLIRMKSMTI
jgi:threonylcarbamoyladenosine tRNA methylthiotransferase MtaB